MFLHSFFAQSGENGGAKSLASNSQLSRQKDMNLFYFPLFLLAFFTSSHTKKVNKIAPWVNSNLYTCIKTDAKTSNLFPQWFAYVGNKPLFTFYDALFDCCKRIFQALRAFLLTSRCIRLGN